MNFDQLFSSLNPSDYTFINNDEHHSLSMSNSKVPMFSPGLETGTKNLLSMSNSKAPVFSPGLETGSTNLLPMSNSKAPMFSPGLETGTTNLLSMSIGKAPMFSPGLETGTTNSLSISKGKAPMFSPGLETGTTNSLSISKGKAPMFSPGFETGVTNSLSLSKAPMFSPGLETGATSNKGRKPRGRPRGSKNKSKQQVPENTSFIKTTKLEIPSGTDIVRWVREYAQSRLVSVNVIASSGIVTQAVISQLRFELRPMMYSENHRLFSLSGTCMSSPGEPDGFRCFTAMLGLKNGAIVGGEVKRLLSVGPVQLTAIIANNMEAIE